MNVEGIQMAQEQAPRTCCCEHHELTNLQVPQKMGFLDEPSNCQVLNEGLHHTAMQYCSNTDRINKDIPLTDCLPYTCNPHGDKTQHKICTFKALQTKQIGLTSNASDFIEEVLSLNLSQDTNCPN
jgi:hypothetical protein